MIWRGDGPRRPTAGLVGDADKIRELPVRRERDWLQLKPGPEVDGQGGLASFDNPAPAAIREGREKQYTTLAARGFATDER